VVVETFHENRHNFNDLPTKETQSNMKQLMLSYTPRSDPYIKFITKLYPWARSNL